MARSPWNLQVSDHPAAVAYPAFPDEVAEVLRAAAAAGLSVAAQGTGHGAPPLEGRLADAVLLRTSAMTELRDRRRAADASAPGAGVLWGDLAEAAGRHGLAGAAPVLARRRVVGYSLGGGIGWYARRLGLQCNAVTAVELVLADGTFVRATADHEPELFWALRGGGGAARRGHRAGVRRCSRSRRWSPATWPGTGPPSSGSCPRWVAWCADAPDEATTSFRLLDVPADELDPGRAARPPARDDRRRRAGRRRLRRRGARAAARPAPRVRHRRRGCPPRPWSGCTSTRRGRRRPTRAARWSPGCPTPPSPRSSRRPDRGSGTRLAVAELRQLGGALARPDPDGGALSSLDGAFLALGLGLGGGRRRVWPQQRDGRRPLPGRGRAVGDRAAVPADARRPHRHPEGLPARRARPAVRRSAAPSTRTACSGSAPRPPDLSRLEAAPQGASQPPVKDSGATVPPDVSRDVTEPGGTP